MEYSIIKNFNGVSNYVRQVSELADENRKSFGFLAISAYEQMASKGQLWIVLDPEQVVKGYLLFGGTMPTLKIFQLYVCKSVRGAGIGKKLIDALKDHAENMGYHTVSARVAADLPANAFWQKMDFPIYRQEKGGKTTGRVINIRGYSLSDNDLFGSMLGRSENLSPSSPVLDRPIYALDLNLLLDVAKARSGYQKVLKIVQAGFQGEFSICVTPEFKAELRRQTDSFKDDVVLRMANAFPVLAHKSDLTEISQSLRDVVFPNRSSARKSADNDNSDLMHLAYCISSRVTGFITREKALLRAFDSIRNKYGLAIISPEELIFDDGEMLDIANPLNMDFTFGEASNVAEVKAFLSNFEVPDVIEGRLLNVSPLKENLVVYEARFDEVIFGVYFFQKPIKSSGVATACLYIDESCSKAIAAIDHFLETALRYKFGYVYRLNLYVGSGQALTEMTLRKKGFLKSEGHFTKIICNVFLDGKSWSDFANRVESLCGFSFQNKLPSKKELLHTGICCADASGNIKNFSWFEFETIISPRFILNADRTCVIVPIKASYASGLIGNITNQLSLLAAHEKTLLLERAYFRSPVKASMFEKGEVVAFYVSGSRSIQEIIGFARVTYSDVVGVEEAALKVGRQGVLSKEDLLKISDRSERVHVFTFDNFLEFDRRISFGKAKSLGLISDANLVSPEKVGFDKFKVLIGEAFND